MGRRLAFVVGINHYDDRGLAALAAPAADVRALAEVLAAADIGAFDEVVSLLNEPAARIQRETARFCAGKAPEDLLLIYFSGHGILDEEGQLYFAARDTERSLLSGSAVPAAFVTREMDRSRARQQILILDCCHSGAFARGSKGPATVGTGDAFRGTSGAGRFVLTATDSTQYAWEGSQAIGEAHCSVFTRHLIDGLRTGAADRDADGKISPDELYDYIYECTVQETPNQTPSKWAFRQQGEIWIARNPRPPRIPELPAELLEDLNSIHTWKREASLAQLEALLHGTHRGLALAAEAALRRMVDDDSRRVAARAAQILVEGAVQESAVAPAASAPVPAEPPLPRRLEGSSAAGVVGVAPSAVPADIKPIPAAKVQAPDSAPAKSGVVPAAAIASSAEPAPARVERPPWVRPGGPSTGLVASVSLADAPAPVSTQPSPQPEPETAESPLSVAPIADEHPALSPPPRRGSSSALRIQVVAVASVLVYGFSGFLSRGYYSWAFGSADDAWERRLADLFFSSSREDLFCLVLAALLTALFADRLGKKRFLAIGLGLVAGSLFPVVTHNFIEAARISLTFGRGIVLVSATAIVSECSRHRGSALNFVNAAAICGTLLTLFLSSEPWVIAILAVACLVAVLAVNAPAVPLEVSAELKSMRRQAAFWLPVLLLGCGVLVCWTWPLGNEMGYGSYLEVVTFLAGSLIASSALLRMKLETLLLIASAILALGLSYRLLGWGGDLRQLTVFAMAFAAGPLAPTARAVLATRFSKGPALVLGLLFVCEYLARLLLEPIRRWVDGELLAVIIVAGVIAFTLLLRRQSGNAET